MYFKSEKLPSFFHGISFMVSPNFQITISRFFFFYAFFVQAFINTVCERLLLTQYVKAIDNFDS